MPEHIVRHSETVCAVAMYLTGQLIGQGLNLDENLVRSAALLHDITKSLSLGRPLDHALTGAKLLKRLGYPQVASVVRQHVRLSGARPPGRISEVEIVNYSDKRVVHDQISSLAERIEYIRRRYVRSPEASGWVEIFADMAFNLEREIFSLLPGGPDQLQGLVLEKEPQSI